MRTLKDVFDYNAAPLSQWETEIGQPRSDGKKHEDAIVYPEVIKVLKAQNAYAITGIIADEALLEKAVREAFWPIVRDITHLTVPGAFEKIARQHANDDFLNGFETDSRVKVITDVDAIAPKSQDAVIVNMILGCVATAESTQNISRLVGLAASYLNENGNLIVVRPNAEIGDGSTYKCVTPANDLKAGKDYEFIINGLETAGPMKNLYTPDDYLSPIFAKAGLKMGPSIAINDRSFGTAKASDKPAFWMNVCTRR